MLLILITRRLAKKTYSNRSAIEKIVGGPSASKKHPGEQEYFVKWDHYPYRDCSWVSTSDFDDEENNVLILEWCKLAQSERERIYEDATNKQERARQKLDDANRVCGLTQYNLAIWSTKSHLALAKDRYAQNYVVTEECEHISKDSLCRGEVMSSRCDHGMGPWSVWFKYSKQRGIPVEWECKGNLCVAKGEDNPKCIHVLLLMYHFCADRK